MSNETIDNEMVSFIQRHEPLINSGKYTISVNHSVSLLNQNDAILSDATDKTIYVAGERFSILSKDIFGCFPPPGNTGDYSYVLPHITLTRSTLPWERISGGTDSKSHEKRIPWMWLFIYDDNDIAAGFVKSPAMQKLSDVFFIDLQENGPSKSPSTQIPLFVEPGNTIKNSANEIVLSDLPVNVIQLNLDWLKQNNVFPSTDELEWLTCVRKNNIEGVDSEYAICIANRLPNRGVNSYACLLSLEGRLTDIGGQNAFYVQGVNQNFTSFVSLTSWNFSCLDSNCYQLTAQGFAKLDQLSATLPAPLITALKTTSLPGLYTSKEDFLAALTTAMASSLPGGLGNNSTQVTQCFEVPDHTFQGMLKRLSSDSIGYASLVKPGSDNATLTLNQYLTRGATALPHHLNTGSKTISWYKGPFSPSNAQSTETLPLPVLSSEQLLRFDSTLNMLDVSYAAAWELGRMLTVSNKAVSMDMYTWKRQQAWKSNQNASAYNRAFLAGNESNIETKEQSAVASWCNNLMQLKNIPFNYLVPDERLLPRESIRFFVLDNLWINSLLDGALSIGRVTNLNAANESQLLSVFGLPFSATYSGFLLRSEVVSGWPHLIASATDSNGSDLTQVAKIVPGPDVALFLFNGVIDSIDLHLRPESLHFGFDVHNDPNPPFTPSYSKQIRFLFSVNTVNENELDVSQVTGNKMPPVQVLFKNSLVPGKPACKVVDIKQLAADIKSSSGALSQFCSAQFALQLLQGVPNVIFNRNAAQTAQNSGSFGGGRRMNPDLFLSDAPLTNNEPQNNNEQGGQTTNLSGGRRIDPLLFNNQTPGNADLGNDKKAGDTNSATKDQLREQIETPIHERKKDTMNAIMSKAESIETNLVKKADDELQSLKARKFLIWIIGGLLGVSLLVWVYDAFLRKHTPAPLLAHFEGVKEIEEIEFVKQFYEELVPVTDIKGDLKFMLTVPASISGKMDMTKMDYRYLGGNTILVSLPDVIVSDVVVDFQRISSAFNEDPDIHLFLLGGGKAYDKAYTGISGAIANMKKNVAANAIKNNIVSQTRKEARVYFIRLARSLGYQVKFAETKMPQAQQQPDEGSGTPSLLKNAEDKIDEASKSNTSERLLKDAKKKL